MGGCGGAERHRRAAIGFSRPGRGRAEGAVSDVVQVMRAYVVELSGAVFPRYISYQVAAPAAGTGQLFAVIVANRPWEGGK
jgi:hypothetical protein